MVKGIATKNTTFRWGETAGTLSKSVRIKSFPDLGGPPEMIEITDLSDEAQSFILGVQSMSAMEFTANFTKTDFEKVQADAGKDLYYEIEFGDEATFEWQGQHSVHVTGGGVNEAVEMVITVAPTTKPSLKGGN
jgi:hypothetical protein